MTSAPTRVLVIAGCGRSGSTVLGHILGQAKGFCFVGEAMYGWRDLSARRCGCGAPVSECDFWTAARRQAGSEWVVDEPRFFALGRLARWRHLALTLAPDRELCVENTPTIAPFARGSGHARRSARAPSCRAVYSTAGDG